MRTTIAACTATCTIAWGVSFSVMKILLNVIDPMQILALRWLLAAIIFSVMVLMGKIRINLRSPYLKYALLAGLMEPCIYSILEIYGVDLMSASLSALFIATIPSMTLLVGAGLFRRKINRLNAIGIALAFVGVSIATVFVPGFSLSGTVLGVIVMTGAVVSAVF
ncbi:MAG: DMT family transporter, partial [Bacillota bacterium]